jgi:hypothetical protein
MGVMKLAELAMSTAMMKGLALTSRDVAMARPSGTVMAAAALLVRISVTTMLQRYTMVRLPKH